MIFTWWGVIHLNVVLSFQMLLVGRECHSSPRATLCQLPCSINRLHTPCINKPWLANYPAKNTHTEKKIHLKIINNINFSFNYIFPISPCVAAA